MAGKLITLEGGEGAGKTTQQTAIQAYLQAKGIAVVLTREPGGTHLGEAIRGLVLGSEFVGMATDAELLLMFAARAEHLAKVIRPALAQGQWVVCDRFIDATYAYQGGGRGVAVERIALLEQWSLQGLVPDLTLWLDLAPEMGLARANKRGALDRFETEQQSFFQRVRAQYQQRAQQAPHRIQPIDAAQSIESVTRQIQAVLDRLF